MNKEIVHDEVDVPGVLPLKAYKGTLLSKGGFH